MTGGSNEDNSDKVPLYFEKVIFSRQKTETRQHIRSLLTSHPHNYIAVYGGHDCGVSRLRCEILSEFVDFLLASEARLTKKEIELIFINNTLQKERKKGAFGSGSTKAPVQNEFKLTLEQLEYFPEILIKEVLKEEKSGKKGLRPSQIGLPNQKNSSFVTFSFGLDGSKATHSLSLLILRQYKLGDDYHSTGVQKMASSAANEFRTLIGSHYKGQERIDQLVRRNIDSSKHSIFLCLNPSDANVQETLHTLTVYSTFGLGAFPQRRGKPSGLKDPNESCKSERKSGSSESPRFGTMNKSTY